MLTRPVRTTVVGAVFRLSGHPLAAHAIDRTIALRAVPFLGRRHVCPCCDWHVRAFTHGGFSWRTRHHGYCPRCNAKARHRRIWLHLRDHTDLFTTPTRLFHVSPKYALSRRLAHIPTITYVGADITRRADLTILTDLTSTALRTASMDAVVCVHVLEHIQDDKAAIAELRRVLRPGGWAVISVPVRPDGPTLEDPSIVSPEDRERVFGEPNHVRLYGFDLADRLRDAGFNVTVDRASEIPDDVRQRYGLLDDENIFHCRRSADSP